MKHKFGIFISVSAVSVFSFLAIAKNTPAPKSAGSAQLEALLRKARAAEGSTLVKQDIQNADLAVTSRIREEITDRKEPSANGRHANIITTDGKVLPHGVVITPEGTLLIGDVAIGVMSTNVDNQFIIGSSSHEPSAPTALRVIR